MDDMISRRAAIDLVDGWFKRIGLNGDICVDGLRQLPSAQPLEDIHREKEQAYYCGYEDGKAAQWDWLKTEIKRMKMTYTICINHDYYTGYMSALSAVEGCIAQLEGDAE